ncbi:microtubule-associated protein [Trypanosoma theileri]|uniref:Microtubule-associated protein n=1 Tax=Trypanosoma theileri TaxID=67003 RepID=A0A1X0P0J6_9TRYP|nr:microtubule-associated protein [Trypanosoma theileri]ORC90432.1 microtubule-associated protein [Trypanosoma theileri]
MEPRHVDPDHFRSTTQDAYKPYDPSAYKRNDPVSDEKKRGPRHVDPNHFRSTTQDAYKPIDPSAYKISNSVTKADEVKPRHGDPDVYRSVSHDSYGPIDPEFYKRDTTHVSDEDVNRRYYCPDAYRSVSQESYKPIVASAAQEDKPQSKSNENAVQVPPIVLPQRASAREAAKAKRHGVSSARGVPPSSARSVGKLSSATPRVVRGPAAQKGTAAPLFVAPRSADVPSSTRDYSCPCHTDPEVYRSTSHTDFKAHPIAPARATQAGALLKARVPDNRDFASEYRSNFPKHELQPFQRPVSGPVVTPRHVDPSMYTTTTRASFSDYWKR